MILILAIIGVIFVGCLGFSMGISAGNGDWAMVTLAGGIFAGVLFLALLMAMLIEGQ